MWLAPLALLAAGVWLARGSLKRPPVERGWLMGWLLLFVLASRRWAGSSCSASARGLWTLVGAALMLGAAAMSSRAARASPPAAPCPPSRRPPTTPELIQLRGDLFGRYTADDIYLLAADALARSGDRHGAAQVLLGGLHAMPRSVALWTALGTALAANDGNTVSPPAAFAFQQAERLSPRHPGPLFFLGSAYVRAGDFPAAQAAWHRALALSPPRAGYRAGLAERAALLDRYLAGGR